MLDLYCTPTITAHDTTCLHSWPVDSGRSRLAWTCVVRSVAVSIHPEASDISHVPDVNRQLMSLIRAAIHRQCAVHIMSSRTTIRPIQRCMPFQWRMRKLHCYHHVPYDTRNYFRSQCAYKKMFTSIDGAFLIVTPQSILFYIQKYIRKLLAKQFHSRIILMQVLLSAAGTTQ